MRDGLPRSQDPNLLLGLDTPDDAAVYRMTPDIAIVQTVDFFTPIVDDPYDWGAIAAANSLSDLYAVGARPLLALNLVGWPGDLDPLLLARVLEGGADKASEAGAMIIGGHTVDDPEPKYGMAVTGTVAPDGIVRTAGATPGMALVLTKPLSMGVIATALKQGAAPQHLVEEATRTMATLNAAAAEVMVEIGVAAATDVTGFGLLGHLSNMVRADGSWQGAAAEVWGNAVPVLDGVAELVSRGFVPGGTRRNESYFGAVVEFEPGMPEVQRTILFDAQTSGGLLMAVEESRVSDLVAGLTERRTPAAAVIGKITDGPVGRVHVRTSG
jgi:selenide, water dikinase